jgi:ribonuclease BN (tRNA processing enzyme)
MSDRPMTNPRRRELLKAAVALPVLGALPGVGAAAESDATKLIILGSAAGPSVGRARYQTSHVLLHKGAAHVVDCGYGVSEQLVRAGVRLQDIRDIFITHHHPDHNIELGTLIYFAWYAGMEAPLDLYGPPPLRRMTADYLRAIKPDVDIWLEDIGHKPMGPVTAHEVSAAGPVMTSRDMKVTAALVNHPPVVPALAYRFDFPDRSIVFSGDTTPMESVARLAKGADVLVHEALYLQSAPGEATAATNRAPAGGSAIAGDRDKLLAHLLRSHSPPEEVGRIAAEAGVKTLVLSHLAPITIPDETWRAEAAKHFKGEIIVARDLMVI